MNADSSNIKNGLSEDAKSEMKKRMAVLITIYLKLTRASTKSEILQAYSKGADMLSAEFGHSDGIAQVLRQLQNVPPSFTFDDIVKARDIVAEKLANQAEQLKEILGA